MIALLLQADITEYNTNMGGLLARAILALIVVGGVIYLVKKKFK